MKHKAIVNQMTIEEKAAFLSGKTVWQTRDIPRLNIPSIFCADGPHGLRKQAGQADHLGLNASVPATCFPTAATIANSWDVQIGEEVGKAIAEEAVEQGVNVLMGPGLNIKRSPLCGRNFEYFSEDPYLSGKMAASYIKGIQSQGVYACPKHFAVNSQELRRMAMNSVIDERTLREIYLEGFEIAIKEGGAKSIMTSYNEVNGTYANENKHLLKEILRDEWSFDGIVITDWGASNDHVLGVLAGSNLEMPAPGLDSAREIIAAIDSGKLHMDDLDKCVDELLDAVIELNIPKNKKELDENSHHSIAKKAASESIVLLKNEENLLPLKQGCKVSLIGDFAITPRYQGAGSSMVIPTKLESMKTVIHDYQLDYIGCAQGYSRTGDNDEALKKAALHLAAQSGVVLYCFGLDEISESEGLDRDHMRIPKNQIELLEALVKVNGNIVGVLSAGSSIEMPWNDCCKSIIHGTLSGQAGASAMMDAVTGKVNPSGKLSETYPLRYEDTPAYNYFPSAERNSEYRESIYVGYRYFETNKVNVQYPFGYGLSYTNFEYEDLQIYEDKVTFTLTNTGKFDGAEVAQLYVGFSKGKVFRAEKELKGFAKVFLKVGESQNVTLMFDDKTFRYWNIATSNWEVEEGTYSIQIGSNIKDIKLQGEITKVGSTNRFPYRSEKLPSYYTGTIQKIEAPEFEILLGQPIPSGKWSGELNANDAISQMYYAKSLLARAVCKILTTIKARSEAKGIPNLNILFIYNMPFRALAKMTGGAISMEMVDGIVLVVNGHFFKGMKKVIKGFFTNAKENKKYENKLASTRMEGFGD